MSKTFIPAALALAIAAPALAQQPAGGKAPMVAVIDGGRVFNESLLGKGFSSQLDTLQTEIRNEGNKKQAELQKMDAALKALQDELDKQTSVLSDEAKERKRQDIVKKTRERQAFLEDGQAELQRLRARAEEQAANLQKDFQNKVQPLIDQVAKEKGIDLLLDSSVAMTINKSYDITQDVIAKADELQKKGGGAPAAGAAPAAAPKPAATPKP